MAGRMSQGEFIGRAVGIPWVRWRGDWQACDCFGLIVLYHLEVLGIDLGPVPQTDIATGFSVASGWLECEPAAGATCFMAWIDGAPTHCGVLLQGDRVLHSEGAAENAGNVRVSRLAAVARVYGPIRCYRYATC